MGKMKNLNKIGGDPNQPIPRSIFLSPKTKYPLPKSQYDLSNIIISPRKSNQNKSKNLKKENGKSENKKDNLFDFLLSPDNEENKLFNSSPININKAPVSIKKIFGSPLSSDFFGSPKAKKIVSPAGIKFDVILDENKTEKLNENDFKLKDIFQQADKEVIKDIGKKAMIKYSSVKSDPL